MLQKVIDINNINNDSYRYNFTLEYKVRNMARV